MKIPKTTQKPRFYLAISMSEALSSWDTVEEASAGWGRMRDHALREPKNFKADFDKIIGVVRVDQQGRKLVRDKAFYGPPDPEEPASTIPETTDEDRYYVATSMTDGLSSWDSLRDAINVIERMKSKAGRNARFREDYESVMGIVQTSKAGRHLCWKRPDAKAPPTTPASPSSGGGLSKPDKPGCQGGLSGCTWEGQHRRDCHRVSGLDLGTIRDTAGKRSSMMQHAIVDATGEIYRLCDQVERLTIERDQARELAEGLRTELNAAAIYAQEAVAAWPQRDTPAVDWLAMKRAVDRLAQVKRR